MFAVTLSGTSKAVTFTAVVIGIVAVDTTVLTAFVVTVAVLAILTDACSITSSAVTLTLTLGVKFTVPAKSTLGATVRLDVEAMVDTALSGTSTAVIDADDVDVMSTIAPMNSLAVVATVTVGVMSTSADSKLFVPVIKNIVSDVMSSTLKFPSGGANLMSWPVTPGFLEYNSPLVSLISSIKKCALLELALFPNLHCDVVWLGGVQVVDGLYSPAESIVNCPAVGATYFPFT